MNIRQLNMLYFFMMLFSPVLLLFNAFQFILFNKAIISPAVFAELYFIAWIFSKLYLDGIPLKQTFHIRFVKPSILICSVVCGMLLAMLTLVFLFPTSRTYTTTDEKFPIVNMLFYILSSIVIAPICEEYIFRDIFFRNMKLSKGLIISALVSSLYFSMSHFTVTHLFTATVLGIVSAIFYDLSQSLIPSILIHSTTNCLPYILLLSAKYCPEFISWKFSSGTDKLFPMFIIALFIILICGFVVIITKKKQYLMKEIKFIFTKKSQQSDKVMDIFFILSIITFSLYSLLKMSI